MDLARDRAHFERVFHDGWPVIYRYLRGVLGPEHDLEAIAAEAFAIAWRKRTELPGPPGSRVWLIGVARNVARNETRSARRRERLRGRLATQPAPTGEASTHEEHMGPASQALARLSLADREILTLYAWGDLDIEELATTLSISRRAASQRLHRARKRLVRELGSIDPSLGQPTAVTPPLDTANTGAVR